MIGSNLEQPGHGQTPPFFNPEDIEKRDSLAVDEISEQLSVSAQKYETALERYKKGNIDDEEYLESYRANLIDWKNDMQIVAGTLSKENKEILAEIEKRLSLVSEAFKQKIN